MTQTVSNTYHAFYLWNHPSTKDIMRKHLGDHAGKPARDTLANIRDYNMGGGIPYDTLTALCAELDALDFPLEDWTDIQRRFDQKVKDNLKCYVYMLINPITNKPFYIGKGTNNRVFQHIEGAAVARVNPESMKYQEILDIQAQGLHPDHIIIQHGLDDDTALAVESALIDTLKFLDFNITNLVDGHNASENGLMSAEEIIRRYHAEKLDSMADDCITVNISRLYKRGFGRKDIYAAAKESWVIAENRLTNIRYVLAERHGLIVEVFEVEDWYPVETTYPEGSKKAGKTRTRYGFNGRVAPDSVRDLYINKSVAHTKKRGQASPVRFSL